MKKIFISHPFADNPEKNKELIDKICKRLNKKNILPISPLHLFGFMEDDSKREEILKVCFKMIDFCDEVWMYGDSKGCRLEQEYAKSINKQVISMY